MSDFRAQESNPHQSSGKAPSPTPQQRSIIEHIDGSLLLLAPVGSGKTLVLAERALHAIASGIPAERILCLTFTNRAAEQMRSRLRKYSVDASRKAVIRTFHGFCANLLRVEARVIGLPADFVIYDDVDSAELVAEIWGKSRADSRETMDVLGRIEKCKRFANRSILGREFSWQQVFVSLGPDDAERAMRYQSVLTQQHAIDFSDLILSTRRALQIHESLHERWSHRFDFIQVDEVQDTNISEYEIVRVLAQNCRRIAMIGDTDQTIYEWRGSDPTKVLEQFRQDFSPRELPLTENHRATRHLLQAADSFANSFGTRATRIVPASDRPEGDLIVVHRTANTGAEGSWIADQISALSKGDSNYPFHRVAVLGRTNQRATTVASALDAKNIPCLTVEAFEFFRRQEVKDALAYLRLLVNPYDSSAMRRIVQRPRRGIGDATVRRIVDDGEPCGLRLSDMARVETVTFLDPFRPMIDAYDRGDVVVFDVETTGLAVQLDEVVELAAVRLRAGRPVDRFYSLLRNTRPVGESGGIHGYSDIFLAQHGREAREVLAEFLEYVGDSHLVGHNVEFDIKMVHAQARRLGLNASMGSWSDTWNIANRFVESENYSLATLAKRLALAVTPTHKASDDVDTTEALLAKLMPMVRAKSTQRGRLVADVAALFAPVARQVGEWRTAMTTTRPPDLVDRVLQESGLQAFYEDEPARQANLKRLVGEFRSRDDSELHPETALRALLEFSSLAKNMDFVSETDNKVASITVHQAKGLEFDSVFIAGAVENEMPSYYSLKNGEIEEEKHLFYVAMTRAKERMFISSHDFNERGFNNPESRFIRMIDPRCCTRT